MKTLWSLISTLAMVLPSLAATTTWPASTNANQTFFGINTFLKPLFSSNVWDACNVRFWGAQPGGDVSPMLNSMTSAGIYGLYVPEYFNQVSTLTFPAFSELFGQGWASGLTFQGGTTDPALTFGSRLLVLNMQIAAVPGSLNAGVRINGADYKLNRLEFIGFKTNVLVDPGSGYGVVEDCAFSSGEANGVLVCLKSGNSKNVVARNRMSLSSGATGIQYSMPSNGDIIQGNTFEGGSYDAFGIEVPADLPGMYTVDVFGNFFEGVKRPLKFGDGLISTKVPGPINLIGNEFAGGTGNQCVEIGSVSNLVTIGNRFGGTGWGVTNADNWISIGDVYDLVTNRARHYIGLKGGVVTASDGFSGPLAIANVTSMGQIVTNGFTAPMTFSNSVAVRGNYLTTDYGHGIVMEDSTGTGYQALRSISSGMQFGTAAWPPGLTMYAGGLTMALTSTGLGIFTPTPARAVLDVNGDIRAATTIAATNGFYYPQIGTAPTAASIGGTVGSITNHLLVNFHGSLVSYWSDGTTLWSKVLAP